MVAEAQYKELQTGKLSLWLRWNATKAKRDVKKRERDQTLQKAWEREFNRWMEEPETADSMTVDTQDLMKTALLGRVKALEISTTRLARGISQGAFQVFKSLILEVYTARTAKMKMSLQIPSKYQTHSYIQQYTMANRLQNNSGLSKSLDPNIDVGPLLGSLRSWNDIESEISAKKRREEVNKSPAQKAKEKEEREAQAARHARRMQNRAAIEKKRGTPWDTEPKVTDVAAENLFNYIKAQQQQAHHSNKWGSKIASKLHSKATQERIEAEAKQQILVLERNFEMARKAEEERWLQELGENRNARNANIHVEKCMTSQSLLERGGSRCEDCKYDSKLAYLAEEKEQRRLRTDYNGN
ncbi:hypothetical protein BPAE_0301g00030 [Botrytis paeoniae]|uniref:Uncharacterized protein n=1 Tax=Botrytis paeoniae TaxID=278948 RepID=A0A4Z1F7W8_9HELO|nr:hypothetical protein BPAE_0301g00030 [Botrytis paeoniae]